MITDKNLATDSQVADFKCQRYFSLNHGQRFDASRMVPRYLYLTINDTCSTHHSIKLDNNHHYQCRYGDVSKEQNINDLRRSGGAGEQCNYTTWNSKSDPSINTTASDLSRCGFNKDEGGYCMLRKGDKRFLDTLAKIKGVQFSTLKCHVLSNIHSCVDAQKTIGHDLLGEWLRRLFETDDNRGYANYANNDHCIQASITSSYWQNNSVFFSSILASCMLSVLVITTILLL